MDAEARSAERGNQQESLFGVPAGAEGGGGARRTAHHVHGVKPSAVYLRLAISPLTKEGRTLTSRIPCAEDDPSISWVLFDLLNTFLQLVDAFTS